MAFRTVDDIKETVRSAGMRLAQQLTNGLIRSVSEKNSGQEIISTVLPFLLGNFGLNASAQGVQLFALQSIVKLCDETGDFLKPTIPEIVDQLLDVLTSLEPQEVNYIGFHVEKNIASLAPIIFSKIKRAAGLPTKVHMSQIALIIGGMRQVNCVYGDEEGAFIPSVRGSSIAICDDMSRRS
jgi:hypothetical protein